MDIRQVIATRLADARSSTGMSTRNVAERLKPRYKISHATIANYEKGISSPPMDVLAALATLYEKPLNSFLERGSELRNVRYRNLTSKVKVGDRNRYEADAHRWLDAYVAIERRSGQMLKNEFPNFPKRKPNEDAADVARRVREWLGLNPSEAEPITSVVDVLHRFGIRVLELPTDLKIDGFAAFLDNEYVVVLNPSIANDRSRMNAAHELAHILLGDCDREKSAILTKDEENQAFEFASHLLFPNRALNEAFKGQSFLRLLKAKEQYGISLAAMIYRAEKQGTITSKMAKKLWITFSQKGWRTTEPGIVRPDRATRFEELLEDVIVSGRLTLKDAAKIGGVRPEELRQRIDSAAAGIDLCDDEPSILSIENP
jgi:Zn-dependent peptidase ImmA (M78 family)